MTHAATPKRRTRGATHEDNTHQEADDHLQPSPPDGGWGWVVVFASFAIHIIADGVTYSFGVFYLEFLDYFNEGKGATAWIASILVGVTLCSGPISSSFVNKYGCRAVTIAGSFLAAVCMVLSVFAQNIMTLYLTIGLGTGLGFGLIYLPAIVSVTCYFEKKRSLATGIAVCGSGLGTFVFAPLTEYLIVEYGWRGAMLIIAGLVLNCSILGALFRPVPVVRESKPVSRTASACGITNPASSDITDLNAKKDVCERDLKQGVSNKFSHCDRNALHRPYSIGHFVIPHTEKINSKPNTVTSDISRLALSQPALITSAGANEHRWKLTFGSQSLRKSSGIMYRRDIFYHGSLHNIPHHRRRKRRRSCTWPGHTNFRVLGLKPESKNFFNQAPLVVLYSPNSGDCLIDRLGSNQWIQQDVRHATEVHQLMDPDGIKGSKQLQVEDDRITICGCLPHSKETRDTLAEMLDFALLMDPIFILFTVSNFCTSIGFSIPYIYIVAQAKQRGISVEEASFLLAVIGIANLVGRIILGYIADKPWINRLHVYNVCLTICGLATAFSAFCYDFPSFVIYATVYGFTIGAYVGLTSVILVDLLGLDRLTNAFGLLLLFQGFASFLGPPIAGWMYDALYSYNPGFYMSGFAIAASGVMLFFIPSLQRYLKQQRVSRSSQKSAAHQNGNSVHSLA